MFSGKVVHLPLKEFSDSNAMQNAENRTVAKTLPLFLQYYAKATNIQIVEINQPLFKINISQVTTTMCPGNVFRHNQITFQTIR